MVLFTTRSIREPASVQFARLAGLLRKNPRYFFQVAPVFMVVPAMAAWTVWYEFNQPDTVTTRTQEPWDRTHYHIDMMGTVLIADNLPQERQFESHLMMDYL